MRLFGTSLGIEAFVQLFYGRQEARLKIPKAVEAAFERENGSPEAPEIAALIRDYKARRSTELEQEQELFAQRKRLVDAGHTLQTKTTNNALDDQRIATSRVSKARLDLEDLRRTELLGRDARIFPGCAPVMVVLGGHNVVLRDALSMSAGRAASALRRRIPRHLQRNGSVVNC